MILKNIGDTDPVHTFIQILFNCKVQLFNSKRFFSKKYTKQEVKHTNQSAKILRSYIYIYTFRSIAVTDTVSSERMRSVKISPLLFM